MPVMTRGGQHARGQACGTPLVVFYFAGARSETLYRVPLVAAGPGPVTVITLKWVKPDIFSPEVGGTRSLHGRPT